MNSDFKDAHQRHWEDAELLYSNDRWANADHLYGVAAECALKCLMLAFGMPFDDVSDRPKDRQDRQHADGIWLRYETYRSGHHRGIDYGLPSNPFADWSIEQRHANRSNFDPARVNHHKQGTQKVRDLLQKAVLEGLI